jgi:hypothetical protein
MKKVCFLFGGLTSLLSLLTTIPAHPQEHSPAHVGIVYPLSTHGTKAAGFTNSFSLHALWGLSGGEKGLGLYGVGGVIKGDAAGLQASGVFNSVAGSLRGVQMSGVMNQAHQVDAGMQLAGLINIAEDVRGSQFAGLINIAGRVEGVQIAGLINIADSSDYPIGIINLIKNGEKRISISTDENLSTLISLRSGGRKLYGIIGLGANLLHADLRYAAEAGLGIKLLQRGTFRLDMEASHLFATDFHGGEYFRNSLRLLPTIQIGNRLQLFGGPSINFMDTDPPRNDDLSGLAGFTAGLHVVL